MRSAPAEEGGTRLESLAVRHLEELRRVGLAFGEISAGIEEG